MRVLQCLFCKFFELNKAYSLAELYLYTKNVLDEKCKISPLFLHPSVVGIFWVAEIFFESVKIGQLAYFFL